MHSECTILMQILQGETPSDPHLREGLTPPPPPPFGATCAPPPPHPTVEVLYPPPEWSKYWLTFNVSNCLFIFPCSSPLLDMRMLLYKQRGVVYCLIPCFRSSLARKYIWIPSPCSGIQLFMSALTSTLQVFLVILGDLKNSKPRNVISYGIFFYDSYSGVTLEPF